MRKLSILAVVLLVLTGCTSEKVFIENNNVTSELTDEGETMEIMNATGTVESIADARMEQIINIINNQDEKKVYEIFSTEAKNNADDFEEGVDKLFTYINGDIISWKRADLPGEKGKTKDGRKTQREIDSYYYLSTEKEDYFVVMIDYPIDIDNPGNQGLYLFLIVKEKDADKVFDGNEKILFDGNTKLIPAGINIPLE